MRAVALLFVFCLPGVHACEGLKLDSLWIRLPPPGAPFVAAYASFINLSNVRIQVIGIQSADFASAVLHQVSYHEGRAQMRHLDHLTLEPGQQLVAAPGGTHIMLDAQATPVESGMMFELSVQCDTGPDLSAWFQVRRSAPE